MPGCSNYPHRLAQVEAVVFALGVEATAIGIYAGSAAAARAGSAVVAPAALLATATAATVWQRRAGKPERAGQ